MRLKKRNSENEMVPYHSIRTYLMDRVRWVKVDHCRKWNEAFYGNFGKMRTRHLCFLDIKEMPKPLPTIIPDWYKKSDITNQSVIMLWRYVYCCRKRTSLGQIAGKDGKPKYDKLDRGPPYYNALHQQNNDDLNVPPGFTTTETLGDNNNHSIDLSELREFMRASELDVCSKEMIKMGVAEHSYSTNFHRRRFSVDLGEVREFISVREMRIHSEDESTV